MLSKKMTDRERAELFLSLRTLSHRTARRYGFWGLIAAAGAIALSASAFAFAAETQACPTFQGPVNYSATFQLKTQGSARPEALRLMIGTTNAAGQATAQIWSGTSCQATCQVTNFGKTPTAPLAMDLRCRSVALGTLSAQASVLFDHSMLRFGNWVDGYEQTALRVEVDRYSAASVGRLFNPLANRLTKRLAKRLAKQ